MFRKGQHPNILFAKSKMINFALCLHSVFLELSVQALAVLQFLTWLAGRTYSARTGPLGYRVAV